MRAMRETKREREREAEERGDMEAIGRGSNHSDEATQMTKLPCRGGSINVTLDDRCDQRSYE